MTETMHGVAHRTAGGADVLEDVELPIPDPNGLAGTLRTTMTRRLSPVDAATLREAHELVEDGHTIGKVVLAVDGDA